MKKVFKLWLIMTILIPNLAFAKDVYFNNKNGVSLTKKEYDYLTTMFDENYINNMNLDNYNYMIKEDLLDAKITSYNLLVFMPLSVIHETASKSLKISTSCTSTICSVSVSLKWLKDPTVRSYDVMGAYFSGTKLLSSSAPQTLLTSTTENFSSSELVSQNSGFGVTIKLPSSGTNISLYQAYYVEPGGIINASYQHAKSATTLENSKKYTISNAGYGGVFLFNDLVKNKYDAMGGVRISV